MVDVEVQVDGAEGDGGSGEDVVDAVVGGRRESASSEIRRAEIIAIVRKITCVINEIHEKTDRVSSELSDEEDVIRSGLNYIFIIKEAFDQLLRFLESPLGERATALMWKYSDGICYLAEVGAGIFLSSMFVVVTQELLLDVKEDEFDLARRRIKDCIHFVHSKVPEIERRVSEAAELLRCVREDEIGDAVARGDNTQMDRILWKFKDTIRHAKLDIDDCNSKLEDADNQIQIAMAKIKAKTWLNGAYRGALFVGGVCMIYFGFRNRKIGLPLVVTVTIGSCLSCASLLVRVPRYRKLEMDFLEYKNTHDSLRDELKRLQRRLDSHEHALAVRY